MNWSGEGESGDTDDLFDDILSGEVDLEDIGLSEVELDGICMQLGVDRERALSEDDEELPLDYQNNREIPPVGKWGEVRGTTCRIRLTENPSDV